MKFNVMIKSKVSESYLDNDWIYKSINGTVTKMCHFYLEGEKSKCTLLLGKGWCRKQPPLNCQNCWSEVKQQMPKNIFLASTENRWGDSFPCSIQDISATPT